MNTLLRNFRNWAIKNGLSSGSASSYCTYLRKLDAISPFAMFGQHYLQIIADFLNDKNRNDGDSLYALSICDRILQEIETELVSPAPRLSKPDLQKGQSALRLLLEFLRYRIILCSSGSGSPLDNVRKMLSKSNLHKIDGMDSLIAHFGVNNFVRMAIESSYFFDIEIKMDRNDKLIGLFKNENEKIPARATTKGEINPDYNQSGGYYCENGTPLFPIDIDPDGNKFVRQLINSYTGYTIGQGKGSIFQNYIISHIWGRAYDPRFFTSFWNIVLIPAWANSLMDKDAPQGSVASKLKATFMAICWQYYQLASCSHWGALQMGSHIPQVVNPQDVVHGEYTINVIQRKPANMHPSIVAPIIQVSVPV